MAKSKRELDKDLMFQKIMPALSENPFTAGNSPKGGIPKAKRTYQSQEQALQGGGHEEGISVATVNAMEEYTRHVDAVMKGSGCANAICRRDVAYAPIIFAGVCGRINRA